MRKRIVSIGFISFLVGMLGICLITPDGSVSESERRKLQEPSGTFPCSRNSTGTGGRIRSGSRTGRGKPRRYGKTEGNHSGTGTIIEGTAGGASGLPESDQLYEINLIHKQTVAIGRVLVLLNQNSPCKFTGKRFSVRCDIPVKKI